MGDASPDFAHHTHLAIEIADLETVLRGAGIYHRLSFRGSRVGSAHIFPLAQTKSKMYSASHVKLHLQLWHDGRRDAGHVILVISNGNFWEMLGILSEQLDIHLRKAESLENFFEKLQCSLEVRRVRETFRWSHKDANTDFWIQAKKARTESKVYCRRNESQKWNEAVVKDDEIGILPNHKLLQCALAEYLIDDRVWLRMLHNDQRDYIESVKTLNER